MVLPIFKNRAAKKAMESAKASYIKATTISGMSRESRIFKSRIAGRSRAHLDKVFVQGAEQSEAYQEACLAALSDGQERPEMPEPQPFQTVKTKSESVYTYVPSEFAKEMYTLGSLYQAGSIGPSETLNLAQELAAKVSIDIGLEEPFIALQFLRDELEEDVMEADGDDEEAADSEDDTET
jgi:hypothetical protein